MNCELEEEDVANSCTLRFECREKKRLDHARIRKRSKLGFNLTNDVTKRSSRNHPIVSPPQALGNVEQDLSTLALKLLLGGEYIRHNLETAAAWMGKVRIRRDHRAHRRHREEISSTPPLFQEIQANQLPLKSSQPPLGSGSTLSPVPPIRQLGPSVSLNLFN